MTKKTNIILLLLILCLLPFLSMAQSIDPSLYSQLHYRTIGPDGNRAISVIGVPGDPSIDLVGAASGGIWKTKDGGARWYPVFDDKDVSSVSALAVSRSNHNIMWAGTGETFFIRPQTSMGNGVYKSTDYGEHWKHMGLEKTGRIARIDINPVNPDIVFVCALGNGYGPQKQRGVYRTTDGGKTWKLVLRVNNNTGCSDLDIDPNNPNVIFAAFWQLTVHNWKLDSGGPGSGVWRSRDGGDHWEKLSGVGKGLPGTKDHPLGKVAVQVAPSNSDRVYVLAQEHPSAGFYVSNDGGDSWRLVHRGNKMVGRAPYYTRFAVDPENENRIYFIAVGFNMSIDGGRSLVRRPPRAGGDNHSVWIDPTNPDRFMDVSDGGLSVTLNHGKSFSRYPLPIAQMYNVHVDNDIPYHVYGDRQDGYSYMGPSMSRQGYIPLGLWTQVGGCESGYSVPDTSAEGYLVWSGCYDGGLQTYDRRNGAIHDVRVFPKSGYGVAPKNLKYRWNWIFPVAISPHNHKKVYVGAQYVFVTTNEGHSWTKISPDLTRDLESQEGNSGGLTYDNLMTFDGAVLISIAISPEKAGIIWTGSNDGLVHVTRDGGKHWTNVTPELPDFPKFGTISSIEPSYFNTGTAYISVDDHQQDDFRPLIYKTDDFGKTWKKISAGIPQSVFSYVHVVIQDPEAPGILYAGTENQIYFSPNDGKTWLSLRNNMPPAPIYGLTIQKHFNDLVVATYGRGFWILDDISPLRKLGSVKNKDLYLFNFRPTYRWFNVLGIHTTGRNRAVFGQNPPYGADINYYLKKNANQPAKIEIISDRTGKVVRTLSGPAKQGINRVWWHLNYAPPAIPKLRTPPPQKPWIHVELKQGWRPVRTWDLDLWSTRFGPRVAPGTYTVRVTVGNHEVSKKLKVQKDPASRVSIGDMRKQAKFALKIRDQISEVSKAINQIEWIKKSFKVLIGRLKASPGQDKQTQAILARAGELNKQILKIESNLFDVHLSGAREDAFRHPNQLYGQLRALGHTVTGGRSNSGYVPTVQQHEVFEELKEKFEETQQSYNQFVQQQLVPFYQKLYGAGASKRIQELNQKNHLQN